MSAVLSTAAVDTFEHIIRQQTVQELLPFLLHLPKADVIAVRQKTRRLQRELDRVVELGRTEQGYSSWGRRGTAEQDWMLFLAGLRTYTRKEALTNSFGGRWIELGERADFWTILEHVRPDWLGDWLQRWTTSNQWSKPQYRLLRELEDRQLIDYQPALFAASTPQLLHEISRRYQAVKTVPTNLTEQVLEELRADATLLTRDLPLVFDFDTTVDTAQVWAQDERPDTNSIKGNWQAWYEQHPPQTLRWAELLPALVDTGHLDRADLLTRCLLALRRDFRRPLLTWFKNLYLSLQPSAAEQLTRQNELVELLAHPLPLVVNFALDQLKTIWLDPGFATAPLLQYAEGLMNRADLKTSLRGLLGGLEKLQRHNPALAPMLAPLYVGALANADAGVQERAAKLLAAQLGARQPALSAAETAATQAAISQYADLLGANARALLAPYLAAPEATEELSAEAYEPQTGFVPELSAATAIEPVQDWHELLFLTGQVLLHNDPVALERWIDGLIRLRRQFPVDYAEPLQPYLLQMMPGWKKWNEAERQQILSTPPADGHTGLVRALVLGWAGGFTVPLVGRVNIRGQYSTSDPLVEVDQLRLAAAEQRLRDSLTLPLLSTPTHLPAWVAPTALVQRLLAHEAAQQPPAPADLALALARTAHAHPAEAAAALSLLPQLQHEGLRELLTWFLAPEPPPLPASVTGRKSVLKQFTARLSPLIPRPAGQPSFEEALPWLWAVAARTRQPEAPLPALSGLTDYPGVAAPWTPQWQLVPKSYTYVETWKAGKPEHTNHWLELELPEVKAAQVPPSNLLLYSLHARYAHQQYAIWQLQADFSFLVGMLPNYATPLYWHTLRCVSVRSGLPESGTRDLVTQALTPLLHPGPRFDDAATLLLAVALAFAAAECRALALEVLLAAVETGRLDAAALGATLGRLLAADMMPVQRLTDTLAQARAISPRTDDALRQVLDTALPMLPAAPPRNTKKLLDLYADLLGRLRQPAPLAVRERVQPWASSATLKKTVAELLK